MTSSTMGAGLLRRLSLWLELRAVWRKEFNRVRRELGAYTDRELMRDLLPASSDIYDLAVEAADQAVAERLRREPAPSRAWHAQDGHGPIRHAAI